MKDGKESKDGSEWGSEPMPPRKGESSSLPDGPGISPNRKAICQHPRDFLKNQYVYAVISQRSEGLSVGINMNPDQACNFDCVYCEVKRTPEKRGRAMDVKAMSKEFQEMLVLAQLGKLRDFPPFSNVSPELLVLKNVALSGDGEPTHCPNFYEIVQEVIRVRQIPQFSGFKLVLITNATGLHLEAAQAGLRLFAPTDEIWAKLDAGTDAGMRRVNRTRIPVETILKNITRVASQRPVVIQSLFCCIDEREPSDGEIETYIRRLEEFKRQSLAISLVQIYSVVRPAASSSCVHLPLAKLSDIARRVRESTGFKVEVF